jgi:hypothetical protein
MKMIITAILAMLLIAPAIAEEDKNDAPPTNNEIVNNPPAEFAYMAQCAAMQLSLMHLHLQIAASITALSASDLQPSLAAMVASYKSMAEANQKQIASYVDVVKNIVIPEITQSTKMKTDDLLVKADQMTNQTLGQIAATVSNPHATFDTQVQLERLMLQQSDGCDVLVQKITQHHTL